VVCLQSTLGNTEVLHRRHPLAFKKIPVSSTELLDGIPCGVCNRDDPEKSMNIPMKSGTYRHSKTGKLYRVLGVAKHSETLEDLVVYETLYRNPTSKLWVRPVKMFLEKVEVDGKKVPRFKYCITKKH
jgi:hypothetical protein